MYSWLTTYLETLDRLAVSERRVIDWGCPVPFFGGASTAAIATVGINPSNREFVDEAGCSLAESKRRLPTLGSLGLDNWGDANTGHLRAMVREFDRYFMSKPYGSWFGTLERLIGPSGVSFYGSRPAACHLDLVPFATKIKWGTLPRATQRLLMNESRDSLARLLRDIPVGVLVLNGRSVVNHFELLSQNRLDKRAVPSWNLPRSAGQAVPGIAYSGWVDRLGGIAISRRVRVLGFNHNLQSSFGVTANVVASIGSWISDEASKVAAA